MATGGIDVPDETFDFLCNGCQEIDNVSRRAADYCKKCKAYFCEGCLNYHNKMPTSKDHRDQLIGKDIFSDMSKTRLQPTSVAPHSSNDIIFGCHTCADAGKYKLATDYCKACSEYLCDVCLIGHNKWTHHTDNLLGIADLEQMIDARLTQTGSTPRSTEPTTPPPPKQTSLSPAKQTSPSPAKQTSPLPPMQTSPPPPEQTSLQSPLQASPPPPEQIPQAKQQTKEQGARPKKRTSSAVLPSGPAKQSRDNSRPVKTSATSKLKQSNKAHWAVDETTSSLDTNPMHGEDDVSTEEGPVQPTHGEVDWSFQPGQSQPTHGEVDDSTQSGQSHPTHGQVDDAPLSAEQTTRAVYRTEKVRIRQERDQETCRVWGSCPLPDGGWLIADINNSVVKRLDSANNITDAISLSGPLDVCYIPDGARAAVAVGSRVEIISLGGAMRRVGSVETGHDCYSVTYNRGSLYVTARWGKEIYQYALDSGELTRTICPRDPRGQEIFSKTDSITASKDGALLFVADWDKGLFIVETKSGDVRHNTRVDGGAWCVSYHRESARLAVMVWGKCDYMFVFHMK